MSVGAEGIGVADGGVVPGADDDVAPGAEESGADVESALGEVPLGVELAGGGASAGGDGAGVDVSLGAGVDLSVGG